MQKAFMISISGNEISEYYKDICVSAWESFGLSVEQFEASTPENLRNEQTLRFDEFKFYKTCRFTPTEIAVWYSHYRMWEKCVEINEPIIILEHDAYPLQELPSFEGKNVEFFVKTITKKKHRNGYYGTLSPAAGYYLTPTVAAKMIHLAKKIQHNQNVDGFIYHITKPYLADKMLRKVGIKSTYYTEYYAGVICAVQYFDECIGSTINHEKTVGQLSKRYSE